MKSKAVIQYLKKNLKKEHIISAFSAGSIPDKLVAKSDLDIFIVIREKFKNQFFNKLKKDMDSLLKNDKSIKYIFLKGPIKYEKQGLIHFLIYTDTPRKGDDNYSFQNEHRTVLKEITPNPSMIFGKNPKELLKNKSLKNTQQEIEFKKRMLKRYNAVKNGQKIYYRKWTKTKNGWLLRKTEISLNNYQKNYLMSYWKKHNRNIN